MTTTKLTTIAGPYFEDLSVGDTLTAPAVTLTDGHVAMHQAILGDRLVAFLDQRLARRVFAGLAPVPPGLVIDLAIGQSSVFTRRVRANLFYRGLQLHRLPAVGDTLSTTTEVVALRQSSARSGKPATGLAVLRIRTNDQEERSVLDFERCAMLPLRDPQLRTGRDQDVTAGRAEISREDAVALASEWNLSALRGAAPRPYATDLQVGDSFAVEEADPVTAATELTRLTVNLAEVHYDSRATGSGQRLVYGGHTIGLAYHQAAKAIPALCAVIAWHSCDHTGPVYEDDLLTSSVSVEALSPLDSGGALVDLRSLVVAHRGPEPNHVLDWRYVAAIA
jgi:acyl dehydratase